MSSIGFYLILFGAGSAVLNLIGMEFIILMWVDMWGATVGWAIRGGMVALGVVLMILGRITDNSDDSQFMEQ